MVVKIRQKYTDEQRFFVQKEAQSKGAFLCSIVVTNFNCYALMLLFSQFCLHISPDVCVVSLTIVILSNFHCMKCNILPATPISRQAVLFFT